MAPMLMALTAAATAMATGAAELWDIAAIGSDDDNMPASSPELVAAINAAQDSWVAHVPAGNMTRGEVRRLCGSPRPDYLNVAAHDPEHFRPVSDSYIATKIKEGVPASLDARTNWPACAPIIGHVRNQGAGCGDCWAYGATQALQDRYCIATGHNDSARNLLSTEDTLACMDQFIGTPGQGCAGGDPQNAMVYLSMYGVVSGGDYGESDHKTCLPFAVPPSGTDLAISEGSSRGGTVPTPKCPKPVACDATFAKTYNKTWATDKHKSSEPYFCNAKSGPSGVACLQTCLMNGPIESSMVVFGEIWSYKSGVYKCGSKAGGSGHSIVIIGWGTETNGTTSTPYWLVKNSVSPFL